MRIFQLRDLCLRVACHKLVMHKKQRRNGEKMNKPMTTAELFEKICGILKEKRLYPDILDYALAKSTPTPITTYKHILRNNLDYGGSEGIYLDLWIEADTNEGIQQHKLGTFKTLESSRDAMHIMAKLLADFIVEENAYVSAHFDDFCWEGVEVYAFNATGKKLNWSYTFKNMEGAIEKKDILLREYPRIVIRDNATREEKSYTS